MAKQTTGQIVPNVSGGYVMDMGAFETASGKHYSGLNIIKLEIGQAGGPFKLTAILKDQNLNKKKKLKKGEKPNLVDIYVAEFNGQEVRMPASKSFIMKAIESKLKIGDIFAIKRVADYKNDYSTDSKSWELKILNK